MERQKISIFWFRRDFRLHDNAGLFHALSGDLPVLPLFIFDTEILEKLASKDDARVSFIYNELQSLTAALESYGSSLLVKHGKPLDIFKSIVSEFDVQMVFCNRDYEPSARERDKSIFTFLQSQSISFKGYKDQVIFDRNEVVKSDGKPYLVFTPYMRAWRKQLETSGIKQFPSEALTEKFVKTEPFAKLTLQDLGFEPSIISFPHRELNAKILVNYKVNRDFPAITGTSKLSLHLRFGTISIRQLFLHTNQQSETFSNELIWREFYMMILYHFPSSINNSIKPKYDLIEWENNENHFNAWCKGKTGYPLVDAGMRELNTTGYMHNRVRMVVASFLCKHLLIDWRWGEAYFAEKLLDYEQSSNVGGWQWAAGSGCDAAPYFRIFNPSAQFQKFDREAKYVKKWVPEWGTAAYVKPIIDHDFARKRALARYKEALTD